MYKQKAFVNSVLATIAVVVVLAFVCNSATLPLLTTNTLDAGYKIELSELVQEEHVGADGNFFSLPLAAIAAYFFGQSFLFNAQKVFNADRLLSTVKFVPKYPLYILFQSLRIPTLLFS